MSPTGTIINMKIISWNVNGVRAISKKGFFEFIEKEKPDVLCLQETKAHPEQLEKKLLEIPDYKSYWNNPERKGYAGVSVYTRIEPREVNFVFPSGRLDTEGRSIELDYGEVVLINVYFPNGGSSPERLEYKLKFYEKFIEYLVSKKKKNIIFCGDINTAHKEIDLARPNENKLVSGFLPVERKWIDKVIKSGYVDTFREFNTKAEQYTWWDYKTKARERNVGWRIDYFFAHKNIMPKIDNAYIMSNVMGSDHCPLGIEIKI